MNYRNLQLKRHSTGQSGSVLYTIHDGDTEIGQAGDCGDGTGYTVAIHGGNSPAKYGLDRRLMQLPDMQAVRDWAQDRPLKAAIINAGSMSTVDVQRLRGALSDVVTNRAALAAEVGR